MSLHNLTTHYTEHKGQTRTALHCRSYLAIAALRIVQVQRCGPFDAARLILGGGGRTPFSERFEAFFTDYSLLPLLVHQNYLMSLVKVDPNTRVEVTAGAAAAVSDADIISGKMRFVHEYACFEGGGG